MNIDFVDEPPPSGSWNRQRRREAQEFAAALKKHPGKWAVYPWPPVNGDASRALASRISAGRHKAFTGFEAVSRRGTVYIRYPAKGEK